MGRVDPHVLPRPRSRPSLSVPAAERPSPMRHVLPRPRSRPSLSAAYPPGPVRIVSAVLPRPRSRPSLSAQVRTGPWEPTPSVAEAPVSALIERRRAGQCGGSPTWVLPRPRSRPSLSAQADGRRPPESTVLPRPRSRPSLSGPAPLPTPSQPARCCRGPGLGPH